MHAREFSVGLFIADQPSAQELGELAAAGFGAVVNLRHEGEPDQPLGVAAEADLARSHGLAYHAHSVGGAPLASIQVTETIRFIDNHLAALADAIASGTPLDGTLRQLVEQYLLQNPPSGA